MEPAGGGDTRQLGVGDPGLKTAVAAAWIVAVIATMNACVLHQSRHLSLSRPVDTLAKAQSHPWTISKRRAWGTQDTGPRLIQGCGDSNAQRQDEGRRVMCVFWVGTPAPFVEDILHCDSLLSGTQPTARTKTCHRQKTSQRASQTTHCTSHRRTCLVNKLVPDSRHTKSQTCPTTL